MIFYVLPFLGLDQSGFRLAILMAKTPSMLEIMSEGRGSKLFTAEQQLLIFHLRVAQALPYHFIVFLVCGRTEEQNSGVLRAALGTFEKLLIAHSLLIDASWGRKWPIDWINEYV